MEEGEVGAEALERLARGLGKRLTPWFMMCEGEGLGRADMAILLFGCAFSLCYDPEEGVDGVRRVFEQALPGIFRSL